MIERLDGFTADGFGNVIEGDPVDGDVIRITIGKDVAEQRFYKPPEPQPPPDFKTFTAKGATKIMIGAWGLELFNTLLLKYPAASILLQQADRVDRNSGNIPAFIAMAKSDGNITDQQIAALDNVWKAS